MQRYLKIDWKEGMSQVTVEKQDGYLRNECKVKMPFLKHYWKGTLKKTEDKT